MLCRGVGPGYDVCVPGLDAVPQDGPDVGVSLDEAWCGIGGEPDEVLPHDDLGIDLRAGADADGRNREDFTYPRSEISGDGLEHHCAGTD